MSDQVIHQVIHAARAGEHEVRDPRRIRGRAEVNGVRLYYELSGSGPPLVLIAGETSDRRIWTHQVVDALGRYYRVLRYDLRGFGRSAWVPGPYLHARDLAALLDHLGIARAGLVTVHGGANVAADLALEQPERVAALVLINPGLGFSLQTPRPPALREPLDRFMRELREAGATPSSARRMIAILNVFRRIMQAARPARSWRWQHWVAMLRRRWIAACNFPRFLYNYFFGWRSPASRGDQPLDEEYLAQLAQAARGPRWLDPPAMDRLGEIGAPTLLVIGQRINPVARQLAEMKEQGIVEARLVAIAGAGFDPELEEPRALNRVVLEFLQAVYPARGPSSDADGSGSSL